MTAFGKVLNSWFIVVDFRSGNTPFRCIPFKWGRGTNAFEENVGKCITLGAQKKVSLPNGWHKFHVGQSTPFFIRDVEFTAKWKTFLVAECGSSDETPRAASWLVLSREYRKGDESNRVVTTLQPEGEINNYPTSPALPNMKHIFRCGI